jgi:propionate catabolism operon transcriptional regulator
MSQIIVVSPFPDLTYMVRSVAGEMGLNVEIIEGVMTVGGWLEDADRLKERLDSLECDAIVSRGGTAFYLAHNLNYPVVNINTSLYDIIDCCKQAKKFSPNIIITSFKPLVGLDLVEDLLGKTVSELIIKSLPDLERKILELSREGDYCIVGGGVSVQYAKKYGVPNVFLSTGPITIKEALLRAQELAELHFKEKLRGKRLQAILECANEGILAVDEEGRIEICNRSAEKILDIKVKDAVGKRVETVVPNTKIPAVLKDGIASINEFQETGGRHIVTSRVPVRLKGRTAGVVATFQEASNIVQIGHKIRKELSPKKFQSRHTFDSILGESGLIRQKKELAKKFAGTDLTVFINGPSGTGKELFAQGIHHASRRSGNPFVAINCGALPPNLLESELFGYAKGAFTGARQQGKAGLFEMAHGGTIFLDEIDALPIELQGRLLRVLQEKEVLRISTDGIVPVDIRVLAASNKSAKELLENNLIREDLFYRLNVLYLEIPPLCQRKDDLPVLCHAFLPKSGVQSAAPLLDEIMPSLQAYSWPGNVRELQNFMDRLSFFVEDYTSPGKGLELLRNIAPEILQRGSERVAEGNLKARLDAREKELIIDTLNSSRNMVEASRRLGIGKTTLWRKIKKIQEE